MKGTGTHFTCGTHTHTRGGRTDQREIASGRHEEEGKANPGEQGVFVCPRHEEMSHNMLLTLQDYTPA